MRIKAFYSADEININLYTMGSEWMTLDGVEYIGLYHTYSTGEAYTQPSWNPNKSTKLIKFKKQDPNIITYNNVSNINLNFQSFETYNVVITQQNIDNGYVDRYILKKNNENKFFEVSEKTYQNYRTNKIDPALYSAVQIIWYITGDVNDAVEGSITTIGVQNKNISNVKDAEQILPRLSTYLTDPLQYYTDNDYISPTDINGLE